jgi:hypothetical protein
MSTAASQATAPDRHTDRFCSSRAQAADAGETAWRRSALGLAPEAEPVTLRNASIEDLPVSAMQAGVPVAARDTGHPEATFPLAPRPSSPATTQEPGTFRQTWPSWQPGPTRGPSSSSSGKGSACAADAVTGTLPHHRRQPAAGIYVFG